MNPSVLSKSDECTICKKIHVRSKERWRCDRCGETVRIRKAVNGKAFHRKGSLVHTKTELRTGHKGTQYPVVVHCGNLNKLPDGDDG